MVAPETTIGARRPRFAGLVRRELAQPPEPLGETSGKSPSPEGSPAETLGPQVEVPIGTGDMVLQPA